MMISAFARESDLSVDAVRFYVRRGLLRPEVGAKGGSRPYRMFSARDVEKAHVIRIGQALGLSLREIGAFLDKRTFDGSDASIVTAFLSEQRRQLTRRIAELEDLVAFVDAKTAWLENPIGEPPPLPGEE